MTLVLTAHQPLYIPWLGFFQKVSMSDVFCLWDDVQFSPNDYIQRNRIKSPNGPLLLTIPILTKDHREKTIKDMRIDDTKNWQRIHWNSLKVSYENKAPYFESYNNFFREVYEKQWEYLADLDEYILKYLLKELGISVTFIKASEIKFDGKKSERVLDMCIKLGADIYIFGETGEEYADKTSFQQSEVKLYFQKYKHPIYPQLYGNFESHLSVLDLLFCFGEKSYDILTRKNPTKEELLKKFTL